MKTKNLFLTFILLTAFGCSGNVSKDNVEEAEVTDSAAIWCKLAPDDSTASVFTYNKVEGNEISRVIYPEKDSVSIQADMTILEQNTEITRQLISSLTAPMREQGFMAKRDSVLPQDILAKSQSQHELVEQLLDSWVAPSFRNGYKEAFYESEDKPFSFTNHCVFHATAYPVYMDSKCVSYLAGYSSYVGGAHGDEYYQVKTFDIQTGKVLSLADFVRKGKEGELRRMVVAGLAKSLKKDAVEPFVAEYISYALGEEVKADNAEAIEKAIAGFPLPEPGLCRNGLVFSYPRYSVAVGAAGSPMVVVPFDEIKDILLPGWVK